MASPKRENRRVLADQLSQLRRKIRFTEEGSIDLVEVLADDFWAVTAGKDDFEVGLAFAELRGHFGAGHAFGHHHVGEEQIDLPVVLLPEF